MLLKWRRAKQVELPTTSIYFAEAMRSEIGPFGSACHRIWRASPNVFVMPGIRRPQILVIRKLDQSSRHLLASHPNARVLYLIDDDVFSGIEDASLPRRYRERLRALAMNTVHPLLQRAERVYVSSAVLHHRLARQSVVVQPGLVSSPPDLDHHDQARLRIVFAGTRAHREDLAAIADPLARFLIRHPECRLETFLGHHAPPSLRQPNAIHHAPLDWSDYRKVLQTRRFHIGLAPSLITPFNAARSSNKMLEFACFGAAPVLGSGAAFRTAAATAGTAFTCDHFRGDWFALLDTLYDSRSALRDVASRNKQTSLVLGSQERLRHFWGKELGLQFSTNHGRAA